MPRIYQLYTTPISSVSAGPETHCSITHTEHATPTTPNNQVCLGALAAAGEATSNTDVLVVLRSWPSVASGVNFVSGSRPQLIQRFRWAALIHLVLKSVGKHYSIIWLLHQACKVGGRINGFWKFGNFCGALLETWKGPPKDVTVPRWKWAKVKNSNQV